ncbi:MAG: hypothetical protein Crog4KO_26750 [Crocinitomicaceae bacterium]
MKAMQWVTIFTILMFNFQLSAQHSEPELEAIFQEAERYSNAAMYGESLESLNQLIHKAAKAGNDAYEIKASILKAEIFRKTRKFQRGIEILEDLHKTSKYPELHVRKLGRMAAIYREDGSVSETVKNDTVLKLLNQGIEMAQSYELIGEEAGLRNELGFMQAQQHKFEQADANLAMAMNLFKKVGDTENEMWVTRNIMSSLVWQGKIDEFKEMYPEVVNKIEETDWFQLQGSIYELISKVERVHGDEIVGWQWQARANDASLDFYERVNTRQMAAFTNIHDTERFKKEALEKQAALDQQQYALNQYIFLSVILLLLVALILVILVRERRLKKDLNKNVKDLNRMNDKYEMLIVESNHRIKNNLQMITSMLEFTKKGNEHSRTEIIQSISGKIQTISTLHKHLYVDMHNEFVDLKFYFSEIIEQYQQMELGHTIEFNSENVQIRSERIVYFGLILNEMLSNTIEHSKNTEQPVRIEITSKDRNIWSFNYCDHSKHEEASEAGTGLQLIQGLVGRIGGTGYGLDREIGCYKFQFETKKSEATMAS